MEEHFSNVKRNVKAFEIAKKGMRWKIGNGMKTKFWSDIWLEDKPLKESFPRLFLVALNQESSVASIGFWDGLNWQWVLHWRRDLFEWEKEQEVQLIKRLHSVFLDVSKPDEIVWSLSKSGRFSTKSFYNELCRNVITREIPVIKGMWRGLVPHKVEIFLWLACLGKINSLKVLVEKGIIEYEEATCILCEEAIEDHNHLLIYCVFAQQLWCKWFDQWSLHWVWRGELIENFEMWKSPWSGKFKGKVWASAFFVMCWTIWKERNERTFNNKKMNSNEVMELFWLRLGWWIKGWNGKFPYTPEQIQRNPACILWEAPILNQVTNRSEVWEPPPARCVKWNVEASMVAQDHKIKLAIGGVLRDETGLFRCVFYMTVNGQGINEAEYEAILKAMELSSQLDLQAVHKIVIESDSMNAVKWVNGTTTQPWPQSFTTNKIKSTMRHNGKFLVQYKNRESNQVADGLAKMGNQRRGEFIAWL